jgi:glutamine cyclotransferase
LASPIADAVTRSATCHRDVDPDRRDNRVVRFHRVQVVRKMPHPGRGFSQGLLAEGSSVWESVGNYGESALRRYELGAGAAAAQAELTPELFGEGICRVADRIWQLTWRERIALSWDAETLELREKVRYNREGWGMCSVGQEPTDRPAPLPDVVTSDGTSELVRRDPVTLEPREVVHVRCQGQRVRGLNDLTWAGGLVWANVAGTDYLAGIDLELSEVTDVVDAAAAAERHWRDPQAIMNGVAAVAAPGEFLLTGKGWRSIRQARLVPDRDRGHVQRLLAGWSR